MNRAQKIVNAFFVLCAMVRVRAERSAPASRRIYVIAITAVDAANQASPARVVTLTVPPAKLGSASSLR